MSPSFPSGKTTGIVTTSLPYGVMVWHAFVLARNWADLSYVAGKPSFLTVFSKFAMPDLLTKDALPNDINSKLLSSELFNLFFGCGSMEPMASRKKLVWTNGCNGTDASRKKLRIAFVVSLRLALLANHMHGRCQGNMCESNIAIRSHKPQKRDIAKNSVTLQNFQHWQVQFRH